MEKINNYKSILLDVLENTNYKRLILCENINGFIYNILTEKGIKFKNYENIQDIDISFDDDNFLIISIADCIMRHEDLYQTIGKLILTFPNNILISNKVLNENYLDSKLHKTVMSLGFQARRQIQQNNIFFVFYIYNISSYKKSPDWLNSDNWANPELWEK